MSCDQSKWVVSNVISHFDSFYMVVLHVFNALEISHFWLVFILVVIIHTFKTLSVIAYTCCRKSLLWNWWLNCGYVYAFSLTLVLLRGRCCTPVFFTLFFFTSLEIYTTQVRGVVRLSVNPGWARKQHFLNFSSFS